MKKALITGITGQDGSYLAEFLLEKGYEVHGIVRRASISNTARIDHLIEKNAITLHDGDLSDSSGLIRLVGEIKPDEIYNLAAQSHVQVSFDAPEYSGDVDALGVLRVLEAVRVCGLLAQKPMALFARDSVLEDRTTIRLLEQKKLAIKVTYEQLTEMSDLLEQMKQITYPAVPEYHNAAAEIVSKLLTLTE